MNNTSPKTMLYTHSWFASKEYKLNSGDNINTHLSVSEASMKRATSEKYPLDMIEATPKVANKIDLQLLAFTLTCALATAIFLTLSTTTNSTIVALFSGLFLITTLVSAYITFSNKIRSYTYFYLDSTTPMFTLTSKQEDNPRVEVFVKNLSRSIKQSTQKKETRNTVLKQSFNQSTDNEEQEYLAYTYHLDFLFASGLIDKQSYLTVGNNITERVFGGKPIHRASKSKVDKATTDNIIQFPQS